MEAGLRNLKQRPGTLFLCLFLIGYVFVLISQAPNVSVLAGMSDLSLESFGPRILIISPHPDDEVLAAGGLIQHALAAGVNVQVVFMTSGDGYRRGVLAEPGPLRATPQCYVSYGEMRQNEALGVLRSLGLGTEQITFLGYPDGGMAAIWWRYWSPDLPFASRTTQSATSPYSGGYGVGNNYTAESILRNLIDICEEFQPTAILCPHPQDTHPDHWATNALVSAAVAGQRAQRPNQVPEVYRYMIHRGSWHVIPSVSRLNPMLPPRDLLRSRDTTWRSYQLSAQAVMGKRMAVRLYESQYRMMGTYLKNFIRVNELFAVLADKELPTTELVLNINDVGMWANVDPVIRDPKGDSLGRQISSSGDIKSLFLLQGDDELYVGLESWNRMSSPIVYRIGIYVLSSGTETDYLRWVFRISPSVNAGFTWEEQPYGWEVEPLQLSVKDNFIAVTLPMDLRMMGSVLLAGAESSIGSVIVDTLSWWVVDIK